MAKTKLLPTLLTLIVCLSATARADKDKEIRRFLQITGAGQLGVQVMSEMIAQMKKVMPQVPDRFWNDFAKEAKPEELVDLVVPIYGKYFDENELKDLIRFYETPVGKKFVGVQPKLMQESMAAGQQWGKALAEKVVARLQKEQDGSKPAPQPKNKEAAPSRTSPAP